MNTPSPCPPCGNSQLTDIQSLKGIVGVRRFVMGCISKSADGRHLLEDSSGTVPLSLAGVQTAAGFYTGGFGGRAVKDYRGGKISQLFIEECWRGQWQGLMQWSNGAKVMPLLKCICRELHRDCRRCHAAGRGVPCCCPWLPPLRATREPPYGCTGGVGSKGCNGCEGS